MKKPLVFLGIEGGATRTTAVLMEATGCVLKRAKFGPCNLRLLTMEEVLRLFKKLDAQVDGSSAVAVGAFLAGYQCRQDGKRMISLLKRVWPYARYVIGGDTVAALYAALEDRDGIALICGTGSSICARRGSTLSHVGGWGHVGGDSGSGYWMGREMLRHIFRSYDEKGFTDRLTQGALKFLGLNTLDELVQWSLDAHKEEVASLTRVLFQHRNQAAARRILREAVYLLAKDVALASRKVGLRAPSVALNRGIAVHHPCFRRLLAAAIRRRLPGARVFLSQNEGAVGAALLAAKGR